MGIPGVQVVVIGDAAVVDHSVLNAGGLHDVFAEFYFLLAPCGGNLMESTEIGIVIMLAVDRIAHEHHHGRHIAVETGTFFSF